MNLFKPMTTLEFIRDNRWEKPKTEKHCSSVIQGTDGNFYSYGYHYPLLIRIGSYWFVNTVGYSSSTGKHIFWAKQFADYEFKWKSIVSFPSKDNAIRREIKDSLVKERKKLLKFLSDTKNARKFSQLFKANQRVEQIESVLRIIFNLNPNAN